MGRLAVTQKVWRGVLIMWRKKHHLSAFDEEPFSPGALSEHFSQSEIDCIIRAVDWANAHEGRSK